MKGDFGLAPRGDVLEQHRDLSPLRRFQPKRGKLKVAPGGDQLLLEADRLAGLEYRAISRDPVIGLARDHLPQLLADDVGNAGMTGIGLIGLDMDIVAQWAVFAIQKLDDAEAFVHRIE